MSLAKRSDSFAFGDLDFDIYEDENGDFWFHGASICHCLNLYPSNPSMAIQKYVDETWRVKFTSGSGEAKWFISEQGIYQLAFRSKTKLAKQFQKSVANLLKKLREGKVQMPSSLETTAITKIKNNVEQQLVRKINRLPVPELFFDREQYYVNGVKRMAEALRFFLNTREMNYYYDANENKKYVDAYKLKQTPAHLFIMMSRHDNDFGSYSINDLFEMLSVLTHLSIVSYFGATEFVFEQM